MVAFEDDDESKFPESVDRVGNAFASSSALDFGHVSHPSYVVQGINDHRRADKPIS